MNRPTTIGKTRAPGRLSIEPPVMRSRLGGSQVFPIATRDWWHRHETNLLAVRQRNKVKKFLTLSRYGHSSCLWLGVFAPKKPKRAGLPCLLTVHIDELVLRTAARPDFSMNGPARAVNKSSAKSDAGRSTCGTYEINRGNTRYEAAKHISGGYGLPRNRHYIRKIPRSYSSQVKLVPNEIGGYDIKCYVAGGPFPIQLVHSPESKSCIMNTTHTCLIS